MDLQGCARHLQRFISQRPNTLLLIFSIYVCSHLHPDLVIGLDGRRSTAARSRGDVHADDRVRGVIVYDT